ncbi:MAG: GNAT family N-acetyltransferase [Bryobacteraceae bacterium]
MPAECILEVIESASGLGAIRSEWSSLACNPFQSPEWAFTWWRHFGSGRLHTLVFRKADRISGIVPAFLHRWNRRRQITLIGSGITDTLDPPIDPRCQEEVLNTLGAHLSSDTNWDVCDWQDLSIDTPLRRIASDSLHIAVNSDPECAAASLPETLEEFWGARSKDLRRNVRRYREKAENRGALTCEIACDARPELVNGLIALHEARWRARNQPGMIAANRSAPFLSDIAQEFARQGILRLFALRFEGELAAVIFAWLYRGTLSFYMSGFQPRFEWFSPGQLLLSECLRYSYEHGCRKWDFLRGTEAYKLAWGAQPAPKCRVVITRS